jgi:hypothetical protein
MELGPKIGITLFLTSTVVITNVLMGFIMENKDPNDSYRDEDDYKYLLINVLMWLGVVVVVAIVAVISFATYNELGVKATFYRLLEFLRKNTDAVLLLSFTLSLTLIYGTGMYLIEGKYIDNIVFILGFPLSGFGSLRLRRNPKSHMFTRKMIEAFNLFALLMFTVILFVYTWYTPASENRYT